MVFKDEKLYYQIIQLKNKRKQSIKQSIVKSIKTIKTINS